MKTEVLDWTPRPLSPYPLPCNTLSVGNPSATAGHLMLSGNQVMSSSDNNGTLASPAYSNPSEAFNRSYMYNQKASGYSGYGYGHTQAQNMVMSAHMAIDGLHELPAAATTAGAPVPSAAAGYDAPGMQGHWRCWETLNYGPDSASLVWMPRLSMRSGLVQGSFQCAPRPAPATSSAVPSSYPSFWASLDQSSVLKRWTYHSSSDACASA